jgi:hypothetical protein
MARLHRAREMSTAWPIPMLPGLGIPGNAACLILFAFLALADVAGATGRDFIDETMVAEAMRRGETGLELGADARVDRQDQLQGWYAGALEYGATRRWVAESVVKGLDRGRGMEFAGWAAETRYVVLEQTKFPVSVAPAVEWEIESDAAKHLLYERVLTPRVAVSRVFGGSLLTTGNAGVAWEFAPLRRSAFAWGLGARWPDRRPVAIGAEVSREALERITRIAPQVTLTLPEEMLVRLGGVFEVQQKLYHFIGRVVIERELEL